MSQLNRHKLLRAIYNATIAVMKCGASPELTEAVNAVAALSPLADVLLYERDAAYERIAELEAELRTANNLAEHFEREWYLRGDADEARIAELENALERERIRLAACGVVAGANTQESAARAREVLPEYRSDSLDSVARAVDREMRYRARIAELEAALREAERPAARYRWLRGAAPAGSLRYPRWRLEHFDVATGWDVLYREQLDAAIDADMALDGGQL